MLIKLILAPKMIILLMIAILWWKCILLVFVNVFISCIAIPPRFECGQWMKTKVWPPLKKLLTFTVKKEGVLGTMLHLLGCLMAYLSAFTITYQVCTGLIIFIEYWLYCWYNFLGLFPKQLTYPLECELYLWSIFSLWGMELSLISIHRTKY